MTQERCSAGTMVTIYGAGIIGLSCALEFSNRGASVTLIDPVWPPRGASWAAAGMIAPAFEAAAVSGTHPKLFELCLKGAALWPEWSDKLEAETGLPAGYEAEPSLALAFDAEQTAHLQAIVERSKRAGFAVDSIEPDDVAIRPTLALEMPTDTHVDNRLTMMALVNACEGRENITLADAPDPSQQAITLITAGWQSPDLVGARLPVFPLGGQMLSVEPVAGAPSRTVRCGSLYIVPKRDRVIIGATVEPGVARRIIVLEDVEDLRQQAARLFPELANAPIIERWAGVRPGTPDHAPYLGQIRQNVFVAAGHHRNGILLAPLTAQIMADMILERKTDPLIDAFAPSRALEELQS